MSNPPRAKGTAGETAFVRWARLHGFPMADRQPLRGRLDTGDVDLCPGIVVEIKSYRLPMGVPTTGQLTAWLGQADTEKRNAGARYCPLVVKRPGTTDVGRWFAYLPMSDFALLTGAFVPGRVDIDPVMLNVATLAAVLRSCGYGDPIEAVAS